MGKSIDFLSYGALAELEKYLLATLRTIHDEAGLCHGDMREDNIILPPDDEKVDKGAGMRAVLFDFGHAVFRNDVTPDIWESKKWQDWSRLRRIFDVAKSRVACAIRSL